MCGIYGLVDAGGGVSAEGLLARLDTLAHRGPDDRGHWISPDGRIGLGHRRLAVLDPSPAGHQPMASPCGRYRIVFNGEIYNFSALRRELECCGQHFQTGTDTEVLLRAWQVWGEAALARLNGMFAFALHDRGGDGRPASLTLVRDRVGKKPLYYAHRHGRLEFASELKALSSRGSLDPHALNHYLALGYVPHALCIAGDVHKLPPAHWLRLDLETAEVTVAPYWRLPPNEPDSAVPGEELVEQAGALIEDATRLRLVADVPVGVLLSGGLDSSLVAAAAARVASGPIETFTVSLPGSPLDESAHARIVASALGTRHHELPLGPSGLTLLDEFSPFVDEPLADSSLLPTYLVSALTRRHVTVALGGDGGDELFGGYGDYTASLRDARRLRAVPPCCLRAAGGLAGRLPAGVKGRNRIVSLSHGPLEQMIWGRPYFDLALRRRLFSPETLQDLGDELDAPERWLQSLFHSGTGAVDRMTRTHFGSILPDDFLVKVDRASMAVSLEMRAPLLDYRLVEFAFGRVPDHWKVLDGESRRLQKLLARRWLPADLDIERKQGFSIPLDTWLRAAPPAWHQRWLERLPPMLRRSEAEGLIIGLHKGRTNGARIFALTMLGIAVSNLGL